MCAYIHTYIMVNMIPFNFHTTARDNKTSVSQQRKFVTEYTTSELVGQSKSAHMQLWQDITTITGKNEWYVSLLNGIEQHLWGPLSTLHAGQCRVREVHTLTTHNHDLQIILSCDIYTSKSHHKKKRKRKEWRVQQLPHFWLNLRGLTGRYIK